MTKDKIATFDELLADSEFERKTIRVGQHSITIQELSGADRFYLVEHSDDSRWDLLKWVCLRGMVDPKPKDASELDKLKPEWVVKIAEAITNISGMGEDALEDAENESADVTDIGGSSRVTSTAQSAKQKSA